MTTEIVTCPLCEATCGLGVTIEDNRLMGVRGDDKDVFSGGFICPKGASLKALQDDPDRLRQPLVKRDGVFEVASWDDAFAEIARRLPPLIAAYGKNSVAVYAGNPSAHNLGSLLYGRVLYKALGTRNVYTAGTVDQIPKHFSSGYMFGDPLTIPIPDLDRTDHLVLLGANPLVSNGSLMTAPNVRGRLERIRGRGGKIVVVDPKRTRTAEMADEHHAIRPGTDALLLIAMVQVLFDEGLVSLGRLSEFVNGCGELRALAVPFTPEAVAPVTGLAAADIRRMAREFAAAEHGAIYGRIGTTTQSFGTVASWLVDVLNVLTGNLDREGGAMFPLAAAGQANAEPGRRRGFTHGRWRSRVRDLPEVMGELPVATLADEILTPGVGQVRALITIAGNPCLSTPNATRLAQALQRLDFMVSMDVYLNETSRHADVILPGPVPLARAHYDVVFYQLSVRNVANWTPPVMQTDLPQEWQSLLRLVGIVLGQAPDGQAPDGQASDGQAPDGQAPDGQAPHGHGPDGHGPHGQGPDADVEALDDFVAADFAGRAGLDPAVAGERRGPERLIDLLLRAGPYNITLADLEAAPHGLDLGPLRPRIPDVLGTPSGKIELAPPAIVVDVPRLAAELEHRPNREFVLIGRRQLSSNNSWMHNIAPLVRGSNRCTAQLHPDDAGRLGLSEGALALVRSRAGEVTVPVEITDSIRPGVVSIPHGWGHAVAGTRVAVAAGLVGVNSNVLTDDLLLDGLSGTAVLNGIPVEVEVAEVVTAGAERISGANPARPPRAR